MLLLSSFFRLKELFPEKNGLTRSLLFFFFFFFLKMTKIWVGQTKLNGEQQEDAWPKATANEESAFHC